MQRMVYNSRDISSTLAALRLYLLDTIGVTIAPEPWAEHQALPMYLQDQYRFFQCTLLGTHCLLLIPLSDTDQAPATIQKHLARIREVWEGEVVYIRLRISSFERRRLIDRRIAFVVPGNQMYLPWAGADLREFFRRRPEDRTRFRPSTQALVLHALLDRGERQYTPKALAERLGYTAMALTRAFDELEAAGIGEIVVRGRGRVLQFSGDTRAIWQECQPYLLDPVKKRVTYGVPLRDNDAVPAGLTALSHYSMLVAPVREVRAVSPAVGKLIAEEAGLAEHQFDQDRLTQYEIWRYDPGRFARNGVVDPFSLYLSLRMEKDERVQGALEEMMERIEW